MNLTLLSLGAGVQSTTLFLLALDGTLPKPDGAIFADTGWEPAAVYRHLERIEREAALAGVPVYRVSSGNLRSDSIDPDRRYVSAPYFVQNPDGSDGMGRRQCTSEYKLVPIRRKVRELLGAPAPRFLRVPKGRTATQWVGFSTDEIHRANRAHDSVRYLATEYPLLDLGWSRKDCERYLNGKGWTTEKSACIGCPFHGNAAWRELRDNRPEEWADAVAFDVEIRKGGRRGVPMRGEQFLHRSRLPLSIAPIDRVTRGEWKDRQLDALELIKDIEAEEGSADGCSPYGCRSGDPA
ncbi:hypothetical protein SAMN04515671_2944 [Nakamurella panacisegetis]|uniref:3'-phosphoadenosine 5'-phosphosulfate sulfotransferase (PAPS reductase)/FAD synthetase n=1 Tax=Nakamurella panacisegetis TaxID=1090615 RepID=A0A1H0Q134_9ACTN|nr:hypothetical protein [Nakamurella panacisegetis]SDP10436.1 hypothetical protein SAMN04515671_2944 [Nakamurella panacisegetis]